MKRLIINGENALQFHNDNMNKTNPVVFAKYYSPSCPACIAMSDEWDNMATDIEQNYDTDLAVADIDPSAMTVLQQTSTHSDVDYVPSIVILSNGNKIKQYQDSREKEKMIQFLLDEGHIRRKTKHNLAKMSRIKTSKKSKGNSSRKSKGGRSRKSKGGRSKKSKGGRSKKSKGGRSKKSKGSRNTLV